MTGRRFEMDSSVDEVAGRWFARRRSGDMTVSEAGLLDAWLREDPAHRAALEKIERAWSNIEDARAAPEILALRERARGRRAGISQPAWRRIAAACLAIVILGGGGVGLQASGYFAPDRLENARYATAVGEKRSLTLQDGSVVTLNTDTVLRTVASKRQRLLYLERGQAFFRVAKDADHPFIVHAAGRQVTAVGTAFEVRVEGRRFEVTLVEGKVRVATPITEAPLHKGKAVAKTPAFDEPRTTEMLPGDRLVASLNDQVVVAQVDAADQMKWMVGRLRFEGEPIGQVAAEFSRYTTRKIVVEDPVLARRTVSGTFDADDAHAFAEALEIAGLARIESQTEDAIRLARPQD